ncbi:MAG TPA: long-chain fatty acid--CoA ligase [Smithella sp.]|nr:long-chain fatty acid--CoA ligase [Smithella sp.]HOG88904.1 long-chain fatty acid--CoA ligase [Smithella sp.]
MTMTIEEKDPFIRACKKILTPSQTVCEKDFTLSGYTYGDVFALAAGLKKTLSHWSGEKNICLCTTNKAVVAACILASLTGACKLILPYSFSAHAMKEMRDATGFNFAIADQPEEMPDGVEVITPVPSATKDIRPETIIDPDNHFLRLFTGGSTGKPKVWSKSPRNLLTEAFYIRETFSLSDKDIFVATVPPYHIYGLLFSILVPFVSHARILPDIYTFPQEIISTINKNKASVLVSVPIHYRVLKVEGLSVPSLRYAFSSAGVLDRSDGLHFLDKTGIGITEIYGSTETGGIASRCVSDNTDRWRAFDMVSWRLKENRLCVQSDFTSPEMERDSEGFCLTGDEAREEENNSFILMGRADGVVKVAGKRVDLLDVQNKIKTLPTVNDAFVLALSSDTGRETDIAAVVACDLTETHLKKLMMDIMEPYAVPRLIKIVPSITRTATGKIDRRRIEKFFSNVKK